jgi:hypothetical protein
MGSLIEPSGPDGGTPQSGIFRTTVECRRAEVPAAHQAFRCAAKVGPYADAETRRGRLAQARSDLAINENVTWAGTMREPLPRASR